MLHLRKWRGNKVNDDWLGIYLEFVSIRFLKNTFKSSVELFRGNGLDNIIPVE